MTEKGQLLKCFKEHQKLEEDMTQGLSQCSEIADFVESEAMVISSTICNEGFIEISSKALFPGCLLRASFLGKSDVFEWTPRKSGYKKNQSLVFREERDCIESLTSFLSKKRRVIKIAATDYETITKLQSFVSDTAMNATVLVDQLCE